MNSFFQPAITAINPIDLHITYEGNWLEIKDQYNPQCNGATGRLINKLRENGFTIFQTNSNPNRTTEIMNVHSSNINAFLHTVGIIQPGLVGYFINRIPSTAMLPTMSPN